MLLMRKAVLERFPSLVPIFHPIFLPFGILAKGFNLLLEIVI